MALVAPPRGERSDQWWWSVHSVRRRANRQATGPQSPCRQAQLVEAKAKVKAIS